MADPQGTAPTQHPEPEATAQDIPLRKMPASAHVMSGWPLLMVLFGGAIGGALGGAAYGINITLYKSKLALPVKILLNIVTGIAAFILWILIAALLEGAF